MKFSKSLLRAAAIVAALGFAAISQPASAVVLQFNQFKTGQNLGAISIATLEATQMGSDVQMVLTNTAPLASSFETQLFLAYAAPSDSSVGLMNVSGVATSGFQTNSATFVNAGATWDMQVSWPTSNSGGGVLRLNPGESSTFKLTNATLARLFDNSGRDPFAMIHLQGLSGTPDSTKYTASIIPLPASLPLLLGGLAGFALLTRRRRAA